MNIQKLINYNYPRRNHALRLASFSAASSITGTAATITGAGSTKSGVGSGKSSDTDSSSSTSTGVSITTSTSGAAKTLIQQLHPIQHHLSFSF